LLADREAHDKSKSMGGIYVVISAALWFAWLISWNVAAFWRAKSTAEAPRNQYRLLFAIAVLGFMLAFGVVPWIYRPLWPVGPALGWAMVAVTAAGLAFTWWARVEMGRLWHGGVSRTAEHRVIQSGPFALVRHPIYTGMIAAVWSVAVLQARPMALAGAGLFALGFILKARVEERFLAAELPEYAAYRRRVRMIVPFVI
jgi:protein-S-isoprenylcysteine O-methyltransferase Ste14